MAEGEPARARYGRLFLTAVLPLWFAYGALAGIVLQFSTGTLVVLALVGVLPSGVGLCLGWWVPWDLAERYTSGRAARWRATLGLGALNTAAYCIAAAFVLVRIWSRVRATGNP